MPPTSAVRSAGSTQTAPVKADTSRVACPAPRSSRNRNRLEVDFASRTPVPGGIARYASRNLAAAAWRSSGCCGAARCLSSARSVTPPPLCNGLASAGRLARQALAVGQAIPRTGRPIPKFYRPLVPDHERLHAGHRLHPACGNRVNKQAVIALVLIGVGDGEISDRAIESVTAAEVAGDQRGPAGPGMRAGQGPSAQPRVVAELAGIHQRDVHAALHVTQLAQVIVP